MFTYGSRYGGTKAFVLTGGKLHNKFKVSSLENNPEFLNKNCDPVPIGNQPTKASH